MCKIEIQKIEEDAKVWVELEKYLRSWLKSLTMTCTDNQESRINSVVEIYANFICQNISARFPSSSCEILTVFLIFDMDLLPT